MRYVISGAAGFIGSHICYCLIHAGHQVVALDNLITGDVSNIDHLIGRPGFQFHQQDVCDPIHVPDAVDRVFHWRLWPARWIIWSIRSRRSTGSTGTRNMLELAREHGVVFC